MPLQSISILEIRSSHIFRVNLGVVRTFKIIGNGYLAPFIQVHSIFILDGIRVGFCRLYALEKFI